MNWLSAMSCAVCAVALLAGCGKQRSHIFAAHRYDPTGDCLEAGAAIDVIEGSDPGTCDVRCWISPADEVYVSTLCDAPLGYEDHTDDEAPSYCASALAAYSEGEAGRCPD